MTFEVVLLFINFCPYNLNIFKDFQNLNQLINDFARNNKAIILESHSHGVIL